MYNIINLSNLYQYSGFLITLYKYLYRDKIIINFRCYTIYLINKTKHCTLLNKYSITVTTIWTYLKCSLRYIYDQKQFWQTFIFIFFFQKYTLPPPDECVLDDFFPFEGDIIVDPIDYLVYDDPNELLPVPAPPEPIPV